MDYPHLAKVVAVAEPGKHRRAAMAGKHSIPEAMQFSQWKDMIAHGTAHGKVADCVVIAVMDQLHAEAVADFAAQGNHILCEKPMATSIGECVAMVRNVLDVEKAKVFGIGHGKCRFSPSCNYAADIVLILRILQFSVIPRTTAPSRKSLTRARSARSSTSSTLSPSATSTSRTHTCVVLGAKSRKRHLPSWPSVASKTHILYVSFCYFY